MKVYYKDHVNHIQVIELYEYQRRILNSYFILRCDLFLKKFGGKIKYLDYKESIKERLIDIRKELKRIRKIRGSLKENSQEKRKNKENRKKNK